MGDEIIKIIGYITERLGSMGPQAEQAFRILVEYQRVQGYSMLVWFVVALITGVASAWGAFKVRADWKKNEEQQWFFDSSIHIMLICLLLGAVAASVLVAIDKLSQALPQIMIPGVLRDPRTAEYRKAPLATNHAFPLGWGFLTLGCSTFGRRRSGGRLTCVDRLVRYRVYRF